MRRRTSTADGATMPPTTRTRVAHQATGPGRAAPLFTGSQARPGSFGRLTNLHRTVGASTSLYRGHPWSKTNADTCPVARTAAAAAASATNLDAEARPTSPTDSDRQETARGPMMPPTTISHWWPGARNRRDDSRSSTSKPRHRDRVCRLVSAKASGGRASVLLILGSWTHACTPIGNPCQVKSARAAEVRLHEATRAQEETTRTRSAPSDWAMSLSTLNSSRSD